MELFFAIDASNDVSQDTIRKMKEFVSTQARVFPLSSGKARFSVLSYGEKAKKLLPINEGISVMALRLALNKIPQRMGQRKVGSVLAVVKDVITNNRDGVRAGAKKILITFIAGRDLSSNVAELIRESDELRKLGVSLVVLTVGPFIKNSDISAMGIKSDNVLYSDTDEAIMSKVSKISEIVGAIETKKEPVDIVFVIGSSRNDDILQFELGKKLVSEMVKRLDVSSDGVRVAIVTYGKESKVVLPLDRGTSKENIIEMVAGLTMPEGGDSLSRAIDLSRRNVLMSEDKGARKGVPKTAIVLLTRDPDVKSSIASAMLVEDGVKVKGVALGNSVNLDTVKYLSSAPKDAVKIISEGDLAEVVAKILGSLVSG